MKRYIKSILILLGLSTTAQALKINEVLVANTHTNLDSKYGQFSSWIELYNESSSSINIGGYYLSDDLNNPRKWKIPSGTRVSAKGYLLIWTDGKDSGLHTNFKLKTSGENVLLSDSNSNTVESITYPEQESDISFQQVNDHLVYMEPSPKQSNNQIYQELDLSKKPKFSLDSGFYNGNQTVELTQKNGGVIYYTTDGSIPLKSSKRYTSAITISKTTVIRARALESGKFLSGIKNRTFLIDVDSTLPVISLKTNSKYLFDDMIGIYVKGQNGVPLKQCDSSETEPVNYAQEWNRPVHIEFFDETNIHKKKFSFSSDFAIAGQCSRKQSRKSFKLELEEKYGKKSLDYQLYPTKKNVTKIKDFKIRNAYDSYLFGDILTSALIEDASLDVDYQAYQPILMFMNGEYWGVYDLREKKGKDFLKSNYPNIDDKQLDIIDGGYEATKGDSVDYNTLKSYVQSHDLSNNNNYQKIISMIDEDNFIDYMIVMIYSGNDDWLGGNRRAWKEKRAGTKWRWMIDDVDRGFRIGVKDKNSFDFVLNTNRGKVMTALFQKLVKNSSFKNKFTSRFCSVLNTSFETSNMLTIVNKMISQRENYILKGRWASSRSLYQRYINGLKTFVQDRASVVKSQLYSQFSLSGHMSLSIRTSTEGSAFVDGVKLKNDYHGEYFNGAKVTLKAKANKGYKFVRWSDGQTTKEITVTLSQDRNIDAIFKEEVPKEPAKIVITEINYKSADNFDTGDWIELYNNDSKDIDISGWIIKDEKDTTPYVVPNSTIIKKGKYLIVSEDKNKFKTLFPNITNLIGNFSFGLGKKADSVRVFDKLENLIDSVSYNKNWVDAKGNGKTLRLIDVNSDNNLPESWEASREHGTPGTDAQQPQTKTTTLEKNWNLVGINANLTIEELKEQLGEENLLAVQGGGKTYKKTNPDFLNNLTSLEEGYGYWIKLANTKTLEYTPVIYTDKTIQLKAGWNLINPKTELVLENVKQQLGNENLEVIQGAGKTYKKSNPAFLNTFKKFEEPYGYWVKVSVDSSLSFIE